jgi:uncharacterized protein YoxC
MTNTSTRAHRFSVLCAVVALVWLGWSPLQASAADGATAAVGSTVDASLDPIDAASDTVTGTVDAISAATTNPVDTVSNTVSGTVETVSNTTSGTVGVVSDTVGDTTAAVRGAAGSVGSATKASSAQADQSSATTAAASPRSLSEQQAAATRVESAIGDEGHGSCVAGASTACQTRMDGNTGSWTRSVADILRKLLALTGSGVLSWIFAASFLALAGMLLLHQARDRSELGSARPS